MIERCTLALALVACGTTSDTRVHLAVTADPSQAMDRYQILVGDKAALAQPLATLDIEVPGELAGSAQALDVWGLDGGQQIAFGTTSVTPIEHETVTAEVTLAAASCGSACSLGDTACAGDGTSTCQRIGNCLAFGPPTACGSGDVCTAGTCGPPPPCTGSTCDDGNPCTIDDACTAGTCSGTPKCTTAPANAVPTCGADGTCDFACDSGFMRSGSACVAQARQIFISYADWGGVLGGLAGADTKCQSAASAAGLTGTFKAWLSDSSTSASARLAHSTAPYVLVDGTVVAASWTALTSGTLAHAINTTETGKVLGTGAEAWTATKLDGSSYSTDPGDFCNDWTNASDAGTAVAGFANDTNAGWTVDPDGDWTCGSQLSLYCIQQ